MSTWQILVSFVETNTILELIIRQNMLYFQNIEEYFLIQTDRIYKYMIIDSKRNILFVSIDLRKVFEVVRHGILLNKLENAGIRGPMLNIGLPRL